MNTNLEAIEMVASETIFDLYAWTQGMGASQALSEEPEVYLNAQATYAGTAKRVITFTTIYVLESVDTAKDARLGRIFMNRTLKVYPAFKDFYGLEETIERIVGFFRHAAKHSRVCAGGLSCL
jgi:serine protein kinase